MSGLFDALKHADDAMELARRAVRALERIATALEKE
jgi:hypothetical protein